MYKGRNKSLLESQVKIHMKKIIVKVFMVMILALCFCLVILWTGWTIGQGEKEIKTTDTEEEKTEEETIEEEIIEEITEEETTEEIVEKEVTLSFVGDFYISPMMYQNYEKQGVFGIISEKIYEIFQTVDIAAADHEYVSGDLSGSLKVNYQQYTFLTPAYQEEILKEFSFDVMTLANNHMMDYGTQGLQSTMELVHAQGIQTIGGGNNLDEALNPYTATIHGKKIGIISATRVVPQTDWYATSSSPGLMTTYETTERFQMMKEKITSMKMEEGYDIVLVYVHWGNDSDKTILDSQVALGHGYIDAGADMVIGNHTHVLQGMEFYNGKLICYGISNFLFGSYHSDTMVLTLNIGEDNTITAKVLPCSSELYYTHELSGEEAQNLFRYIESMSGNVTIQEDGTIVEKME